MKRILNYPGSKWQHAQKIIHLMPQHKSYCEPFFGSGAVFFNKSKVTLETINDIDGRLINMFTQMRSWPYELAQLVELTPYSRKEYELSFVLSDDPLEDARRMLVRCWMAIGGKTNGPVGWRRNISWNGPYNTFEWNDLPNRIFDVAVRLKDAQIESKDAIQLINELDVDTLLYVDPPYVQSTYTAAHYKFEFDDNQHIALIHTLKKHDGYVLLSGYDSELYQDLLNDWYKIEYSTNIGITTQRKKTVNEVLWLNYRPEEQTSLNDFWQSVY
ncbi:DNA adenine methylase [Culicoidibacter larvae]|uniref:DNA adenine methylase n=1 Tax=Culicoidibacter larvae TaxID=2579976 RepID=A0A5R8Q7T9_9FIRM|nr:DNA adenine methylase [Culicoidibacter larvae]TLG71175.1 DNA adenine methylase [Culicoidibacter larvae]